MLHVGPICLQTDPVKNTLIALAVSWKTKYAEVIHNDARVLQAFVSLPVVVIN